MEHAFHDKVFRLGTATLLGTWDVKPLFQLQLGLTTKLYVLPNFEPD